MNNITEYTINIKAMDEEARENYTLEQSKDGRNVIRLKKDNRLTYIGSKYSVKRDIDLFLEKTEGFNLNTIFIVFGLAAGEHIISLLNSIGPNNKILIIEPDINIVGIFKTMSYADKIIKNDNVGLYLFNEENIDFVLGSFIEEFNINKIKILEFANYGEIYREELTVSLKRINQCISTNYINMVTYLVLAKECFEGYMKNMKDIVRSSFINSLKDTGKGMPAIVVSAGPSLEKNIHLLKEAREKFIIITGGRTLRPLLEIGVRPDIVCVIDPSGEYYDLMQGGFGADIPLLFCEGTSYRVVNEYNGPKIFFREEIALENITNEILASQIDTLWQGGSVAHVCASLAKYMGCNPIVFVGQDFAYTNEQFHANIAKVESVDANLKMSERDFYVDDVFGDKVRTSRVLDGYRRYMEYLVKGSPSIRFINSTEGGANMAGTEVIPLKDVIEEYSSVVKHINLNKILSENNGVEKDKVKDRLDSTVKSLKKTKKDCEKGLEYSEKISKYYSGNKSIRIEDILRKIDAINKGIENVDVINHLLKPTMYKILMNPKFAEKPGEAEKETGKRLSEQTKTLYEGLIAAINEAIPLIEETVDELN